MKKYKVDVVGCIFKTKKQFEKKLQQVIDGRTGEGYALFSVAMHYECCVLTFELQDS